MILTTYSLRNLEVYLTDVVSSVVTPNQELVGFQKVDIPYVSFAYIAFYIQLLGHSDHRWFHFRAGTSKTVSILVQSSQLAVWTLQNGWVVEPGAFAIKVGTSDQTFLSVTLTVQ